MSFLQISSDALCYVVLDVVIEDGVVVLVITLRSGELYHFIGYSFGVRDDGATGKVYLCVTLDVASSVITIEPRFMLAGA